MLSTTLLPLAAAKNALTFWDNVIAFLTIAGWKLAAIAGIVIGAFVLSWILRIVIRHVVTRIVNGVKKGQNVDDTQALAASPLAAVRVVQRTRTLGSVLNNIANVIIVVIAIVWVVTVLNPTILGSFALLTAALGAGLGFGAQNIVKDVLNGLFMVAEDQLGVGDVVDLNFATGVVEVVGIRVTQIRDVNGTLWFVRNGEILRVGNMSQGWARVIVDLAVPYDSDVNAVQDRMLAAAQELASTPKWRSRIMERPELWGMESISDDAIVLRIVMKTRTTAKDDVARELRARLKAALDEMGVKLPSLNSVVLEGFDGAASITGARPPRTKPVTVTAEPAKKPRRRLTKQVTASAQPGTEQPAGPKPTQHPSATPLPPQGSER